MSYPYRAIVMQNQTASYSGDKYVSYGAVSMKRKFDPTVVPGNWKELWIGLRIGINSNWYPLGSIPQKISETLNADQHTTMFIGLNSSSGSGPMEGGFCKHALGITQQNYYTLTNDGTNWYVGDRNAIMWTNNNPTASSGNSSPLFVAEKDKFRYLIIQFSRTPASYNTTMSMDTCFFNKTTVSPEATSSALLAEAMKQKTFTLAYRKLGSTYNDNSTMTNTSWKVTSDYGNYDQLCIQWNNPHAPFQISDVVVRTSGSF